MDRQTLGALAAGGALAATVCSIAASQILLGIAVALTAPEWRKAKYPRGIWLLPVFFVLTIISALAAGDLASAWPQVRKFFVFLIVPCLAAAFGAVQSSIGFARRTIEALGVLGLLSALWSLVQYTRKYLAAKEAGFDFTQSYIADRTTGFMSHWMTFGGEMMILFLLSAAYLLFVRPFSVRLAAGMAVIGVAIILGWTRGVWIGSFLGALYLLWSWRRLLVLAAPILAALVIIGGPQSVQDRALSIVRPRGDMDSNMHRQALLRTGGEMIKAHPLLGVGPERVEREFAHYAPADIPRPFPSSWWYGHLHNIYVQYAAERGIPAMLSFIGFIAWSGWRSAMAARQVESGRRWILHGIAAAIVGILATGMFEHSLGDSEVLQLTLGLLTMGGLLTEQA